MCCKYACMVTDLNMYLCVCMYTLINQYLCMYVLIFISASSVFVPDIRSINPGGPQT